MARFTIQSACLQTLIAQTERSAFKTNRYDARPAMAGINFIVENNILRTVATDTHRLSVSECTVSADSSFRFTLPYKEIAQVKKILRKRGYATVEIADDLAAFSTEVGTVYCVVCLQQYPRYERVIPQEFAATVTAKKSDLMATFTALMVHRPKSNRCLLTFTKDSMRGKATNDYGPGSNWGSPGISVWRDMPVTSDHDGFTVAFNGTYILDALKSTPGDNVRVRFQDHPMRPIVIDNPEAAHAFTVCMPMQVEA